MSVSESIIRWLKTFNPAEYWGMNDIDTDIQKADVDSYSLVKEPVQNIKSYMSGKKHYTDHYMIQARLASQSNTDRIDNNRFGEALESWVREKDKNQEFPIIADAKVMGVHVTTPFCIGKTATNDSIYQLTIAIKYEKES